jgi:lactoylglutathione lyase
MLLELREMKIEHVALWTDNLEKMKDFYVKFFNGKSNNKYVNPRTDFESYFITFDSGARLEIMHMPLISSNMKNLSQQFTGYAHIAFSTGGREHVDDLTNFLRANGSPVISEPRETGDGYYESVVLDPDGNRVEITI